MYPYFKFTALLWLCAIVSFSSCRNSSTDDSLLKQFTLLTAERTNIDFNNLIEESPKVNVMSYQYFYNGGGVSVGDLNNDGLEDIYFSGNLVPAKLYLNKGTMVFEDITLKAGITEIDLSWKTGVTMADVNGDGKLDIYQCFSGGLPAPNRQNKLYLNQGNDSSGSPIFKDEAASYGLNDDSYSTQAVFFDYDHDKDLDMFLLNHNPKVFTTLDDNSSMTILKEPAPKIRFKLYRNDENKFTDISDAAGLINTSFTYGLGAGIADINNDGWPDIYVSNDYSSPDYLYINNGKGKFIDQLSQQIGHTSMYSMGNDIADVNNDGLPDILTLDMLPEDNHRQKQLFGPDNYEYNNLRLRLGFHQQEMRNMLQLNNGNGTFSEIGQLAGISNTDWSWAPLFADYDNDGFKDLFISNGYLRDYTDMDFLKFQGDYLRNTDPAVVKTSLLEIVSRIPSSNVKNYIFRNNGNLTFSNKGVSWGIDMPSNSNGAAYADLDNDGDLDLIVNNINLNAAIYQNNAASLGKNAHLKIKLVGNGKNTQGIGAKIWLFSKGSLQYVEQNPSRGYQSSTSPILHFGLGKTSNPIDSLRIVWPGGAQQNLINLPSNQTLTLKESDARLKYSFPINKPGIFKEIKSPIEFKLSTNITNDFKRQPLLTNPLSFNGPCMTKADINSDGLEDIFVGGAKDEPGSIYLQTKSGSFIRKNNLAFAADKKSEDADAIFFDANGDTKQDLYVASGGYGNYVAEDPLLQDRLYFGDGAGGFRKATTSLPKMLSSKGCVKSADINGDGFPDLFVGGRVTPGRYPEPPLSYLLINDGKGNFNDEISILSSKLQHIGMVTDAAFADLNGDKKSDLILVGEWMPITAMINESGKLVDRSKEYFGKEYSGWWNKLLLDDLNLDGKVDLVAGNMGLNTQCKATDKEPAELYYKDFDDNGAVDPILCFYIQGKSYPYVSRDELLDQMSMMRTRFSDYKGYADAGIKEIFTPEELKNVSILKATTLKTMAFLNNGRKFTALELPVQAQYAPVFTITAVDCDKDGNKDLLLCGNISRSKLKFGKSDANYGILMKGNGKGRFNIISQVESGFNIKGDVRSVVPIGNKLMVGINQLGIKAYQIR